jgi:hypothetical protein
LIFSDFTAELQRLPLVTPFLQLALFLTKAVALRGAVDDLFDELFLAGM